MIPYRDENPLEKTPVVTIGLIAANIVVYGISISSGNFEAFVQRWGYVPGSGDVVTLFTSMFLHGGIVHLLANMLYLWLFGDNVEDKFGRVPYLVFYLAAGVGAALAHGAIAGPGLRGVPMVGASGAVSAILGAYLVMFPWTNVNCLFFLFFYPIVFKIPAFILLGIWFAGQIIVGMATRDASATAGVAYFAHVGGFAIGLLAGVLFRMSGRMEEKKDLILDRRPHVMPELSEVRQERMRRAGALLIHAVRQGAPADIVAEYAKFERLNPRLPLPEPIQWRVVEALRGEGQEALALEAAVKYVKHYPDGQRIREALLAVGDLFRERDNFPSALKAYERLHRQFPESDEGQSARTRAEDVRRELERTGLETRPPDEEKEYFIIRQTAERYDASEVGRIIAKICGMALVDGRIHAAHAVGVLMAGLSYEQAKEAARDLQAIGVPVLAVAQDEAVYYPDPVPARSAELREDGATIGNGTSLEVKWENLRLVCVGRVVEEKTVEDVVHGEAVSLSVGPFSPYRGYSAHPKVVRRQQRMESAYLDLFFGEPMLHVRLQRERFRAGLDAAAEAGMSRHTTFAHLVKRIVELAPGAQGGEGVDRLFSEESMRPVTFRSREEYGDYLFWQAQLHAHSFAGPGSGG